MSKSMPDSQPPAVSEPGEQLYPLASSISASSGASADEGPRTAPIAAQGAPRAALLETLAPASAQWSRETREAFDAVVSAIELHGDELLRFPDVVSVRPGYRFQDGWITTQPAVIVSVLRKQGLNNVSETHLIPRKLGKVIIDVAPASPLEQLRYLEQKARGVADGGQPSGIIDKTLPGHAEAEAEFAAVETLLSYQGPVEPLAALNESMQVICHVSPDAGWRNLKSFFNGTQERITATMYEFTSDYILEELKNAMLRVEGPLRLILDPGPDKESDPVSKDEVRQKLQDALGDRFEFSWAAVPQEGRTSNGFFPNAYHIKVSVRDGNTMWLSSGNWKSSNQPERDPLAPGPTPVPSNFHRKHNRDWHVIVDNERLASLYELYIRHDIEQARNLNVQAVAPVDSSPVSMPDLFVPAEEADSLAAVSPEFFPEKTFNKRVQVQPLLTPDNYVDSVLPLIESAQNTLYFQNQGLKPRPRQPDPKFVRLFTALRDKSRDPNIDVRIIVRGDFEFRKMLSDMQALDFDMSRVKVQSACHTKGIIVDSKVVVVGSHNWSQDGALRNRDASLIFRDSGITRYYESIFLHDWERLARHEDPEERNMALIVLTPDEVTPPGMVRVKWHDYYED